MHSFTAVVAASALLASVSGSPLYARNTCGVAPPATNTQNTQPLSQPTGIKTAADCQTQCNDKSGCKSFVFGLVDNAVQCKLYSCDASVLPTQASDNLIAYNKACTSVPSVVPTASNPTGLFIATTPGQSTGKTSGNSAGKSTGQTTGQTTGQSAGQAAGQAANKIAQRGTAPKPAPNAPVVPSPKPKAPTVAKPASKAPVVPISAPKAPTVSTPAPKAQRDVQPKQQKAPVVPTPAPKAPVVPVPSPKAPIVAAPAPKAQRGVQPKQQKAPVVAATKPKAPVVPTPAPKAPAPTPKAPVAAAPAPKAQRDMQPKQQSNNVQASPKTVANTCGSKPAGPTSNNPIASPSVATAALCKEQCKANTNCKSFTFGTVGSVNQCRLYSVAASAIPAPTTTAQKAAFKAYDVGCSI